MRNIVRLLWEEATNPNNQDSLYDYISFVKLVLNNEITEEEFKECMEML